MKRIAIVGMGNHRNIGDQIIPKTAGYIASQIDGVEIVLVNFLDDFESERYKKYQKIRRKIHDEKKIYQLMRIYSWKWYEANMSDVDGIIVACGSFKYSTQFLWASYSIVMEFAYKHNIPIMFNALSVENYDDNDWKSRLLRDWLHLCEVKVFTVRDGELGYARLKKNYVDKKTDVYKVGDAAFWTKECYSMYLEEGIKNNIVAINLIRPNIFVDYNGEIKPEKLIATYSELLGLLNANGIRWQLFTNGMKEDEQIIKAIIKSDYDRDCVFVPKNDVELVKYIYGCKAVISARLHAAIVAYSLGIPVSGFVWDDKFEGFVQDNMLQDVFCREEMFSAEVLYKNLQTSMYRDTDYSYREYWKNETKKGIKKFIEEIV